MLILYIFSVIIFLLSFLCLYIKISQHLVSFGFGIITGLSLFHLLVDAISVINNIHIIGLFYLGTVFNNLHIHNINNEFTSEYLSIDEMSQPIITRREIFIRGSFIFHTIIIGLNISNFIQDFNQLLIYLFCLGIHQILEIISLRQIVRQNFYLDIFFISLLPIIMFIQNYVIINLNEIILSYINAFIAGILFNITNCQNNILFFTGILFMYILGIYS